MKVKFSRIVALIMILCVVACSGAGKNPSKPLPTVAIATLMSHPALDQVRDGVIEGLAEQGFQQGRDYILVERNANGQTQVAATIASELSAQKPAVIVAIATPMAQAVKARWQGPLIFAAVTDPVGAGLVSNLKGDGLITGTSDAWPYQDQLKLIREIQPRARRLAVLFNPGEAASQYGMAQIHKFAPSLGFQILEAPVNSTGEVSAAARIVGDRADAFFLSSDNTVISAVGAAFQVAVKLHKPLYVGDSGTVERGGVAAVSVGYMALGVETGKLTAGALRGRRDQPVVVASGTEIHLNRRAAALTGVTIPDPVLRRATRVLDTITQ